MNDDNVNVNIDENVNDNVNQDGSESDNDSDFEINKPAAGTILLLLVQPVLMTCTLVKQ